MNPLSNRPLNRFVLKEFKEKLEQERLEHEMRRKKALEKIYQLRQQMRVKETSQ
jgi:hypothetical protein|tara:strand:+ start:379 stop:540 length:162 start_codon:yes stop_codon:yes gene_type:complete